VRIWYRTNLLKRIKAGLFCPLTLVSAPAGYGKTTLLTELAADIPIAWLSLNKGDNDPVRFWTYFAAALQTWLPHLDAIIMQLSVSPELLQIRSILTKLINEISDSKPSSQIYVLVLDDYHLIEEKIIHEDIAFFLEHLPQRFHLVISTRADPPLPLARMRAHRQLSEFRAQDLRFTMEETNTLLNKSMNLGLSQEDVAALEARTEGWIASLQLAAISMKKHKDIPAFIANFEGTHRYILDYLTEEVLRQQTNDTRTFLLETSILDRLNGSLCDFVTGREDGQEILEKLNDENIFLFPLDDERKWYRYHHLFSSLLVNYLQSSSDGLKEHIVELHKRAALWFNQNGFMEDAILYALPAGDYGLAAQMIETIAGESFMRMEFRTLMDWFEKLPEETFTLHPRLCAYYAHALSRVGKIDAAEEWLKRIEGIPLPPIVDTQATVVLALAATSHQDDRRVIELLDKLLENNECPDNISNDSMDLRIFIRKLYAAYLLSQVQETQGHLQLAADTCHRALDLVRDVALRPPWSAMIGWLHLRLAKVIYEQNELEGAMQHAMTGNDIAYQSGNKGLQAYGAIILALVRQAQGDNRLKTDSKITIDLISEADRMIPVKLLFYRYK
jgi:ATP/maltotriose-dependent transcriptional regulator MalT